MLNRFGIGQPVHRVEDERFSTGKGRYVDDIDLPRQCYGVPVLSSHAHARLGAVDISRATAAEGVLCVLTGADIVAEGLGGITPRVLPEKNAYLTTRPLIVFDRVRFVGDRIAFVVAETAAQARNAADLVSVEYDPLPAVVQVEDAIRDGAPKLWDECATGNVSFSLRYGDKAATDAAFARAQHVVKLRLENNRVAANPMEPRSAIGHYDSSDDNYTLYTSSQNPHGARTVLAEVFHVPETRIRVISPDVGGGFGMKSWILPDEAVLLLASRRCGRPVKWTATRTETLIADNHGRDQIVYGEMALDGAGKILGIRARGMHALGAFFYAGGVAPLPISMRLIPNVYAVPTVDLETSAVFTNTTPLTAYRGAGRPEAVYLVERLLDRAAQIIGMDPVQIRRRNLVPATAMPYRTASGMLYDSGEFERVLDRCLELADWDGFPARRRDTEGRGRLRGRAVAYYIEQGGNFNDRMELRFDPGGTVTIVAGTHSHGQGHATTYAQMVSEWLGVPFEKIRFVQGDTDKVPIGRGTYATRSSMIGGCALKQAADRIIERAKEMAAALLEASKADLEFADGQFRVVGTDRAMSLTNVAKAFYYTSGITDVFGVGLEASGTFSAVSHNHPNGCHVCELELDPDTGEIWIDRYAVVDDVGRVINPMICEGQVHGGLAQGIGQAVQENIVYDPEGGQLLTGSFMDYTMPRATDLPSFVTDFEEVPCTTNPLGIKGIGEAGSTGSPPAIISAILDAVAPLGVEHIDMPATAFRVWQSIDQARSRQHAM
jgi:carbon-monoxide dehydrogenase large subunit